MLMNDNSVNPFSIAVTVISSDEEELETPVASESDCSTLPTSESSTLPINLLKSRSEHIAQMWNQPYPKNSVAANTRTRAVALYLLEEGQPLYTVEQPAFLKMLNVFDKR